MQYYMRDVAASDAPLQGVGGITSTRSITGV